MKLKVIAKSEIPAIKQEDIEKVEYNINGLFVYIIGVNELDEKQHIRIRVHFKRIWNFRVGDEGQYLNWENDFPIPKTPEWQEYCQNYIFEFFETDYLKWFKYSVAGTLDDDWLRHFCIATRNDIVDVISMAKPTVTVEYIEPEVSLYQQAKSEITAAVNKIEEVNSIVDSEWRGQAFKDYLAQYKELSAEFLKFVALLDTADELYNKYRKREANSEEFSSTQDLNSLKSELEELRAQKVDPEELKEFREWKKDKDKAQDKDDLWARFV